ncbi:molybdopterin-dependent oxidoreductase [Halomonas sp. H10-59]|uniref:Molybdopterin-dependent oxidoreductase n=1 Tax=Halomonas sp. H10-59 TaxID=2950874 RepID=A0AAU7KX69_9GAMM
MNRTVDTLLLANVSRRRFLQGLAAGSALVVAARWDLAAAAEDKQYGAAGMAYGWVDNPNVFIQIDEDGSVTVTNHRAEMGQGIRTSLVMVAADELGADWSKVKATQAPGDSDTYGNQDTDGSRSMRHWFDPMRRAAASARRMLEQAAAQRWDVPVDECQAGVHVIVHTPSGRELGFGELAAAARELDIPSRDTLSLKPESEWRLIGKSLGPSHDSDNGNLERAPAVDGEDIVSGKAVYGGDMRLPDMAYAVIARPDVLGASVASVDDSETLKIPGVIKTVRLEGTSQPSSFHPLGGVGVIADNTWAAIEGRKALKIQWNTEGLDANAGYDTKSYREMLEQRADSPGKVLRASGDIEAALADAESRHSATYYMPHLAHATMEPPVAIARVSADGAETWAPVQDPQSARDQIAEQLGIDGASVKVNQTLLGGGFGRKAKPDFVVEAAHLSRALDGRPVQLQWTREDDLHHTYFHALSVDRLEAGLGSDGKVQGWRHRTLAPTIMSIFQDDPRYKATYELGMGLTPLPFDIPALSLENGEAPAHKRIGWFRSVVNLPHAFAIQSFVAELAAAAGRDHRDYLLELLGPAREIDPLAVGATWNYGEDPERYTIDVGRLRGVIERATEEADWGKSLPEGRGQGLAVHHSFCSYTAIVLDVEVNDQGSVIVHQADVAFDCGPRVNPERIRAQMEGSVVMGIGIGLLNEISASGGRIEQDNFHQYLLPRQANAPREVRVHLVDNPDAPMGGVGEPGLPPVAPALTNAIFAATGKRIRELPVGNQLKG